MTNPETDTRIDDGTHTHVVTEPTDPESSRQPWLPPQVPSGAPVATVLTQLRAFTAADPNQNGTISQEQFNSIVSDVEDREPLIFPLSRGNTLCISYDREAALFKLHINSYSNPIGDNTPRESVHAPFELPRSTVVHLYAFLKSKLSL